MKFYVTVSRTISTEVEVEADTAEAAVEKVGRADFPLPFRHEWTGHKDWTYDVEEGEEDEPTPLDPDFPVRALTPGEPAEDRVTCGTCHRSWDDAVVTSMTPAPSGRCPFEYFH